LLIRPPLGKLLKGHESNQLIFHSDESGAHYFARAGVACTVAINKWREFESKSIIQEQQQKKQGVKVVAEIPNSSDSVTIHKALK
jgi:hypothetical protein